jgi:hypothetical protein
MPSPIATRSSPASPQSSSCHCTAAALSAPDNPGARLPCDPVFRRRYQWPLTPRLPPPPQHHSAALGAIPQPPTLREEEEEIKKIKLKCLSKLLLDYLVNVFTKLYLDYLVFYLDYLDIIFTKLYLDYLSIVFRLLRYYFRLFR